MNQEEIRRTVLENIRKYLPASRRTRPVCNEHNLYLDLNLSPLDVNNVLCSIEGRLNLGLKDEDSGRMRTIGDVVDYIYSLAS
ncbi:MAG: hypothetical protein KKB21_04535 [Nanoarchaeota archaeon]|nr:hypothetical protein [Nanoarchaeota archaeon]